MFEGKTLWEIIQIGGFTMYILIFCSVISLTVLIDRLIVLILSSRLNRTVFMKNLSALIRKGDRNAALELCTRKKDPLARVAVTGLSMSDSGPELTANAMERQIDIEVRDLERFLPVLGTIGSTIVYVGLFGTVLGIIRSFQDISAMSTDGMSTVVTGISEALICTATGILIAVPAVIAFNYLSKRVEARASDMELVASETSDLLRKDQDA